MSRIISKYFAALLLCLLSLPLHAEPAAKIEAEYDVIGFGMTLATIKESFTRTEDNYHIESVTKAIGLLARFKPETVRITSQGKITPQGLLPLSFSMTREVDTDKNASAKFNWGKSLLTHYDYKGVNDLPLPQGTQDRLSLLYHLPVLAKVGKTQFNINITDGNNLEPYNFTLAPEPQITRVPFGTFKTQLITNTPVGEEVKYEIWMSTERDNFPCKIIVTDAKGGKLTQVLTGLTITP